MSIKIGIGKKTKLYFIIRCQTYVYSKHVFSLKKKAGEPIDTLRIRWLKKTKNYYLLISSFPFCITFLNDVFIRWVNNILAHGFLLIIILIKYKCV